MKKWEIALNKFLEKWKRKKEVVGAIACGSYVTGNPSKHSDIDVVIILDKKNKWRERGNEIVDGFLIEYFANPLPQIQKYFEYDHGLRRRVEIHMAHSGKVVFDKNGDAAKLKRMADKWQKKKYKRMSRIQREQAKYAIWDMMDNLEDAYESKAKDFEMIYYNFLNRILNGYSEYLGYDSLPSERILGILTDSAKRAKYNFKKYPDNKFAKMFVRAIKLKNKKQMMHGFKRITAYVHKKMGGFDIDGWKLRSKVKL
jgi:predicted nucleotidyltransferase